MISGTATALGSDAATDRLLRILAAFLLLAPLSVAATLLLWHWSPALLASQLWRQHAVMALFACVNTAVLAACVAVALRRPSLRGDRDSWLALLPLLAVLFHLFVLAEFAWKPGADFLAHQADAETLLAGGDPYTGGCWYPPLQAQGLAALRLGFRQAASLASVCVTTADERFFAYFVVAALQFYAIAAAVAAAAALLRGRVRPLTAAAVIPALFVLNAPLLYGWVFRQGNAVMLCCAIAAVLWTPRRPFLAGLAAALGMSLKLYPGVLALPWLLEKRWKALAGMATGLLAIAALQTSAFTDFRLFSSYAANLLYQSGGTFYMDNSIAAFARSALSLLLPGESHAALIRSIGTAVSIAAFVGVLGAFALLWRRRRRTALLLPGDATDNGTDTAAQITAAAALAAALLASPLAWNHHFVLALPLALLLLARGAWNARLIAGVALVFFLPTPPVFPLQHVHAAGAALLLAATFSARQK